MGKWEINIKVLCITIYKGGNGNLSATNILGKPSFKKERV